MFLHDLQKNYKEQIKAHNIRTNEFIKAISILGIKKYQLDNRLCNQFDTLPILSIVKTIENYISNFKPTIVLLIMIAKLILIIL